MSEAPDKFHVFAEDGQVYGPADATLLQQWARDGLISPKSWIYHAGSDAWVRAGAVVPLQGLLESPTPLPASPPGGVNLRGAQLRRIRLFAEMTNEQAEAFAGMLEKVRVRAFAPIVKQGEHGDAMFLILEGEARVSLRTQGKEDAVAMLGVGDFFGEVVLLDEGPRSADVVANKDCTLLKLTKSHFEKMLAEHSELASRFLLAMNRHLGSRLRATNERFSLAQNFARGTRGEVAPPSSMRWNKEF